MKKLLLILFFIFYSNGWATISIDKIEYTKTERNQFSEKDIHTDNDSIELKTFTKNFKNQYADSEFIYEYKTPEKNAWDRFKEWLVNLVRNIFGNLDQQKSANVVSWIIKVIAFLIISLVVYLIVKAILNKEGKWIFGKNLDKKIINYTDVEKNLMVVDFEKLIAKTLESNQKRLTIRYYYLWLLKKLAAQSIIAWDLEKTNTDYLNEIINQNLKDEFSYLSYLYNYIWYGEFELDEPTFEKAKLAFETAIKSLENV